jgi:vanillate O-demethylase ferredoxin subunit
MMRQYSLCNDSTERHRYRLAVLLEEDSRGGSVAMHNLQIGQRVKISPPRSNYELVENSRYSVLIAGGIGVTPILTMAYRLKQLGTDFAFHYCVRSRHRAAFLEELGQSDLAAHVQTHFDDGDAEQLFTPERYLASPSDDTNLYVCGPRGFIDFVIGGAIRLGWSNKAIHKEDFSPPVPDGNGTSFEVIAARSGITMQVPPDKTIADVMVDHGINVQLSCAQGICGTCLTKVIHGRPDHQDFFLSNAEKADNEYMTVCCSRSLTPTLVLDI